MLYTKKGDDGTTKLFECPSGMRISKADFTFEVLGTLDELNSAIGFAKALAQNRNNKISLKGEEKTFTEILETLQENLFSIAGEVAGAKTKIKEENIIFLEEIIGEIEKVLHIINSFIIPGGTPLGAYLDFTRTIARRAERNLVKLGDINKEKINIQSIIYLNRLSSILYALARLANQQSHIVEKGPSYQ